MSRVHVSFFFAKCVKVYTLQGVYLFVQGRNRSLEPFLKRGSHHKIHHATKMQSGLNIVKPQQMVDKLILKSS